MSSGSPARVLEWMERTRATAQSVLDLNRPPGIEGELAELRQVQQEVRRRRQEAQTEPVALLARQAAIEARIRRASWLHQPTFAAALPALVLREPRLRVSRLAEYLAASAWQPRRWQPLDLPAWQR